MNQPSPLRCLVHASAITGALLLSACSSSRAPAPPSSMAVSAVAGIAPSTLFIGGGSAPLPYGGGSITSGLRSGSYALNNTSVDNLLSTSPQLPATRKASDRPGLGTTAGSEKFSWLQRANLFRKSTAPDAVDSFHYNDETGAKAMAQVLGGNTSRHNGLFAAAGERLKVGLVRYGNAYPHYESGGRRIVVGDEGSHYEVRLENRSKKRLEVVLSVDGLNVLSSKPASPAQHGFVLEPKQTYDVDGFRKDSNTVRTFQFGSVAASQATKKGSASNVGVIGLAVFEEDEARAKAELVREQMARNNATAFPGR